jgi:hypothetical protein
MLDSWVWKHKAIWVLINLAVPGETICDSNSYEQEGDDL